MRNGNLCLAAGLLAVSLRAFSQDGAKIDVEPPDPVIRDAAGAGQADKTASSLAPITWMIGDWRAQATQASGQKPTQIDQHIASILGGKALSFSTFFNGVQQYQGLFAYDAGKKAIAFWYPSADGEITSGTVSQQGDYLVLDFQVVDADGADTLYQVRIRRQGMNEYEWALYSHSASEWKQVLSLRYRRN
jgi:hypothetical protein